MTDNKGLKKINELKDMKEVMEHERAFLNEIFIPVMHHFFIEGNTLAYQRYNGNACRQTAFLVHKYLSEKYPQMHFDVWEGLIADHELNVKYEHAWVYGTYRKGKKVEHLLIDLPLRTYRTFVWTKKHVFPNLSKMEIVNKRRLNHKSMGEIVEFYTGFTGNELYAKIMSEIESELVAE